MDNTEIARVCHEANRAYCLFLGDYTQVPWAHAAEWQRHSAIDGVKHARDNPDATPESMHASWLQAKAADGWKYGPDKDAVAKTHPCFMPYHELPASQQKKDKLFLAIVRAMS